MGLLGSPPIARGPYLVGKLCLLAVLASLVARWWWPALVRIRHPALDVAGTVVLGAGLLIAVAGVLNLGDSLRMGLPQEEIGLKTGGLYRFTRNPLYLSLHLAGLAAVLWTANLIVLALALVVVLVHHQIILSEERYLTDAFGDTYRAYASRVRRYL